MKYYLISVLFVLMVWPVGAQETQHETPPPKTKQVVTQDTLNSGDSTIRGNFFKRVYRYFAESNEDKTTLKKFDFSIIGGPHYSSDIKLGIGLVAAGLYRVDRSDLSIPPSNVSLFGDITTSGFYLLGVRGTTLLKGAKYRLDFNAYFFSMPSAFWGSGYQNGMYADPGTYQRLQNQIKADFLYRLAPKFYAGANVSFNYIEGRKFSDISFLNGEDTRYVSTGIGVSFLYDSRDNLTASTKGVYLKLEQRFFPHSLGNKGGFTRTEFTGDTYAKLWKGAVLAYDLHAMFNYGDTPWTMFALMGGSNRMRGYYEGRFRDKQMIETQLELRQKVYGRSGVALWIGAANVFPSLDRFSFKQVLPNYGVGYRWEFKKNINVRLDYGFGKKGISGFLFSINEAF